jgi:hypothetical protein
MIPDFQHKRRKIMLYRIVRFFKDDRYSRTIKSGLSLEEAQAHCQDEVTSTKEYFDGYEKE